MKNIWILFRKELRDAFFTPLLYVCTGLFTLITGWLFFNNIRAVPQHTSLTLTQSVLIPTYGSINFILIFIVSLLTMRSFSEEKKNQTLDLLYLSRLSDWQIIWGKFFSIFATIVFLLSFSIIFPLILAFSGYHDWGMIFTIYLGLIFSVSSYIAVGMFCSSLTDNQIVAAILSFCVIFGIILLVFSANAIENQMLSQMVQYLTVPYHYEGFVKGAIKSFSVIYFFSFVGFFLFLTKSSLESRQW